jgi:CxxC-x17-CxxC domain-containing protein
MGNFNRGDKGGFRSGGRDDRNAGREGGRQGGFQKKEWGGRDSGNKEQMMHQATCSECGKRCEVPFRPVSGKPVFCNDCFSAKRSAGGDRVPAKAHYENRENRGGGEGNNNGLTRQIADMNMKLDRLIKAMEVFTGTQKPAVIKTSGETMEKKSVDVVELKKVLDKVTEKESKKAKVSAKETKPVAVKKVVKKAPAAKKKK